MLQLHLPSIVSELRPADTLLIVDDASTDDSVSKMIAHFQLQSNKRKGQNMSFDGTLDIGASVQLLALDQNHRFGGAVNAGVALITTPLLFLLNNDVQVTAGALDTLASHFVDERVFAVGCLEYENKQRTILGGRNELYFKQGLFWHRRASTYESGDTAWVSGGSGMFSVEKWRQLGGFDSAYYPAYWEDLDLSMRARQRGWRVLFDERAVVFHHHETTNADEFGREEIARLSRQHQRFFTCRFATTWQLILYYFWQPYWRLKK
jgi:GT2 family glycosyltransferase